MKIACCQMPVTDDKKTNLITAEKMVKEAAENGADLVVLPEMFQCPYENNAFPKYAEIDGGETCVFLAQIAKQNSVLLFGGSIPERQDEHIYNTAYVFDRDGNKIGKHRKLHLFDVDIKGGITFKESDILTAGDAITVVDTEYGKIGLAICFDLRFPGLFISMAKKQAGIMVVPAAFNIHTGPRHWETLLRARALDCQSYIVACSPARDLKASYHAYGHSSIISPWGDILAEAGHKTEIIYYEIDLQEVNKARAQIPVLSSLRNDLY